MEHIHGVNRNQVEIYNLEEQIGADNAVRFIEAFVEHLELSSTGFVVKTLKE